MKDTLTELISARICHDLISPVGAIGNGLELMRELGGPSPELELVSQSTDSALAKLTFFRIAFGSATPTLIGGPEAQRTAAAMFASGRLSLRFSEPWGDRERQLVKLFYLLLLCMETSLPRGGEISCSPTVSGWDMQISGMPVEAQSPLWHPLLKGGPAPEPTAKTLHFILAQQCLAAQSITLRLEKAEQSLRLTF
ncbi:MAG: histidine phosphotransferase family protein [Rhodobacteraceae bacterium]|nr:histidine phosphotransferase family protein [Paracoccaceae bacterium]